MPEYRLGRLRGEYCVTWVENGKRHRYSLHTADRREAERKKLEVAHASRLATARNVASLWAAYCNENRTKPAIITMGHNWKALGPHFGHLTTDLISVDICRAYVAARRKLKRQDGTIWTELGHLRTVMTWAAKRNLIDKAPDIERPAKPAPKERYLTRAEAVRLIEGASAPHMRLAIILLLSTAARVGAILDLTWDRVDLDRGQIRLALPDTTTRKGRATVPMTGTVRAALQEAHRGALTEFVVEYGGARVLSIKKGFSGAVARAGLNDVTPHVLRHTAAVWMAEAGRPMTEIAQFLGHSNSRVTERVYARFSPGHLQDAANVLDLNFIRSVR